MNILHSAVVQHRVNIFIHHLIVLRHHHQDRVVLSVVGLYLFQQSNIVLLEAPLARLHTCRKVIRAKVDDRNVRLDC